MPTIQASKHNANQRAMTRHEWMNQFVAAIANKPAQAFDWVEFEQMLQSFQQGGYGSLVVSHRCPAQLSWFMERMIKYEVCELRLACQLFDYLFQHHQLALFQSIHAGSLLHRAIFERQIGFLVHVLDQAVKWDRRDVFEILNSRKENIVNYSQLLAQHTVIPDLREDQELFTHLLEAYQKRWHKLRRYAANQPLTQYADHPIKTLPREGRNYQARQLQRLQQQHLSPLRASNDQSSQQPGVQSLASAPGQLASLIRLPNFSGCSLATVPSLIQYSFNEAINTTQLTNQQLPYHRLETVQQALRQHQLDKARYLITNYFLPLSAQDQRGELVLTQAVKMGRRTMVAMLLQLPAVNPNLPNAQGQTALHLAVNQGFHELVQLLTSHPDINVNQPDYQGERALHVAARRGYDDCYQLLAKQGGHPQVPNNEGDTAEQLREQQLQLLRAVQANKLTKAQQSVQQSRAINPEQRDQAGNTPLHLAVMQGNWAMVQWLVTHLRCNPAARNHQGQTILHLAAVYHGAEYFQALATQFPHLKQVQDYQGLEARAQLPSTASQELPAQQSPNSDAQKSQADKKQATETTQQSDMDQVFLTNNSHPFYSLPTDQGLRRRLTSSEKEQPLTDHKPADISSSLSSSSQTTQRSSSVVSTTPDDDISNDDEDSLDQSKRPLLQS